MDHLQFHPKRDLILEFLEKKREFRGKIEAIPDAIV
jgi:hypothetical protein